jgi:hypothetical protein
MYPALLTVEQADEAILRQMMWKNFKLTPSISVYAKLCIIDPPNKLIAKLKSLFVFQLIIP